MKSAPFSVAVMAKAPIAGFAKTRLIPLLGAAGAARAQRGFVLRTLATVAAAGPQSVTLWCAPDAEQRFFRALERLNGMPSLHFATQCDASLGARMAETFAAHARARASVSAKPLLLVGTDCPVLTPTHLREAAEALADGADAAFAPVEDGGYVMVALRDPALGDFGIFSGIDWSTPHVMTQTRDRLSAAGARWHELAPLWDVDEPADWLRFERLRRGSEAA